MGFGETSYLMDGVIVKSEAQKWGVIAGISLRTPLKPLLTKQVEKGGEDDDDDDQETTPRSEESRISSKRLTCPPAPKKRKPSSRCHFHGVRDFFQPPDLESVFIRRTEKA